MSQVKKKDRIDWKVFMQFQKEAHVHIDLAPVDNCRGAYGCICVKCNQCGRFENYPEEREK